MNVEKHFQSHWNELIAIVMVVCQKFRGRPLPSSAKTPMCMPAICWKNNWLILLIDEVNYINKLIILLLIIHIFHTVKSNGGNYDTVNLYYYT